MEHSNTSQKMTLTVQITLLEVNLPKIDTNQCYIELLFLKSPALKCY